MIEFFNEDCMEVMARYPDKWFDLACVDPEYGINAANLFGGELRKSGKGCALKTAFVKKNWDVKRPNKYYFIELERVSKNRIIWGANYFSDLLPPSMGWIVWDKDNGTTKFSDCELAFSSFDVALRKFTFTWNGMLQGDMKNKELRIHPTQKPVKLYDWLLQNYAKPGQRILDTHGGSMSSAIAAHYFGCDMVICELDKDYFDAGVNRFNLATAQTTLFDIA
jgi:site-specific DNA-methyltransferase (adenine-specific)